MHAQEIINFWFNEITPQQWWQKNEQFDEMITSRFADIHFAAHQGELYSWRSTAHGRLAEIIILDQFSRNMFRDTPRSFASDSLALALAQEAIAQDFDKPLSQIERSFLYMPFMHSESKIIHNQALKLFKANGNESNYEFELKHKAIIDRFGRYPHRNAILGRQSSKEELAFLEQPGSSF